MTPASHIIDAQVWLRGELLQLALANPNSLVSDPRASLAQLNEELALPEGADASTCYAHLVALRQAKAEGLVTLSAVQRRVVALAAALLDTGEDSTAGAPKPAARAKAVKAKAAPKQATS